MLDSLMLYRVGALRGAVFGQTARRLEERSSAMVAAALLAHR